MIECITPANDGASSQIVAFARQCLPNAESLECESISQWATAVADSVIRSIDDFDGGWHFHGISAATGKKGGGTRRLALIREAVVEILKRKRRSLLKRLVKDDDSERGSTKYAIVQLCLLTPTTGYLSIYRPDRDVNFQHMVSAFPDGRVFIPEDKNPPSRAYRKLIEAAELLGDGPDRGQHVIDLGCTPGSWSYVALQAGAMVLGVDSAPPDNALMKNSRFTFKKGDAFSFTPASQVDWMLCDVIADPRRSIDLLEKWISEQWCSNFVVTIKYKGSEDYALLDSLKPLLASSCSHFLLRHLVNNKNEVTAAGLLNKSNRS